MGGSKSERDVKEIQPFVDEILSIYAGLNTLTNDQLRNKTTEFRKKINDYISEEQKEIAELKAEAGKSGNGYRKSGKHFQSD